MELSRQEYWSGLPCTSPGDFPNPGIEPRSPALQADSLLSEPPGKPAGEKHNPIHSVGAISLPSEVEKYSKYAERMSVVSFKKRRKMTLGAWFSPHALKRQGADSPALDIIFIFN